MAIKVLIPMADGCEEIETVTLIDVFRRAGLEVTVAGLKTGPVAGSRRIGLVPDKPLDEVKSINFDVIVLPGGQAGVDNLRKDKRILELLKKMKKDNKLIGAICAAPLALRDAGLIEGVKLTSYPAFEGELKGSVYQQTRVVTDGNVMTSRGPGTAMEFALSIVERLLGKAKADELAAQMIVKG